MSPLSINTFLVEREAYGLPTPELGRKPLVRSEERFGNKRPFNQVSEDTKAEKGLGDLAAGVSFAVQHSLQVRAQLIQ